MTRDQFLTELMGECWYSPEYCVYCPNIAIGWNTTCNKYNISLERKDIKVFHSEYYQGYQEDGPCGHNWYEDKIVYKRPETCIHPNNIDFSTWEGFGKLWEWSFDQDWFDRFLDDWENVRDRDWWMLIDPDRFSDALAKYHGWREG